MIAFIDIETGGFSKERNAICEIALLITDGNKVLHEYSAVIAPYYRADGDIASYKDDAMAIHGIPMTEIEDARHITEVFEDVVRLLKHYGIDTVGGHGIKSFDLPWLNYLMMRFSGFNFMGYKEIDTLTLARNKYDSSSHKLEDLCVFLGIERGNHRALGDARASFELYKRMV